jgi:hypothetical protein
MKGGLLATLAISIALAGCGSSETHESAAESTHEAAMEKQHDAAEKRCDEKGEIIAQGNDETTECVSNEQKQHEIEKGSESGPHYEAEQQANENEAEKRRNEEAKQIENERSGKGTSG